MLNLLSLLAVVHVVQALRDRYFRLRYFRRAISLLRIAINKIVPGQEYITPLHADCFQAYALTALLAAHGGPQ